MVGRWRSENAVLKAKSPDTRDAACANSTSRRSIKALKTSALDFSALSICERAF